MSRWQSLAFGLVLTLGLGSSGSRAADDLGDAENLFQQGAFEQAATIGRSFNRAAGYALAAKATLVRAIYKVAEKDRLPLLKLAATDARRALALDERNVDAHLQLALALGHIASLQDAMTAHLQGYAKEGRAHIDRALELAPDHPWARGLLGIWNLQLVKRGTPLLAEQWYGANEAAGVDNCSRAESIDPDGIAIRYGCALSLLELDPERYGEQAERTMVELAHLPADSAADRLIQNEIRSQIRASAS
jgi:hypothetical protein